MGGSVASRMSLRMSLASHGIWHCSCEQRTREAKTTKTRQGLVTVPFWEYWTSPYSSHLVDHTPFMVGWCSMGTFNDPCKKNNHHNIRAEKLQTNLVFPMERCACWWVSATDAFVRFLGRIRHQRYGNVYFSVVLNAMQICVDVSRCNQMYTDVCRCFLCLIFVIDGKCFFSVCVSKRDHRKLKTSMISTRNYQFAGIDHSY